jgi:hypothetical protein
MSRDVLPGERVRVTVGEHEGKEGVALRVNGETGFAKIQFDGDDAERAMVKLTDMVRYTNAKTDAEIDQPAAEAQFNEADAAIAKANEAYAEALMLLDQARQDLGIPEIVWAGLNKIPLFNRIVPVLRAMDPEMADNIESITKALGHAAMAYGVSHDLVKKLRGE